MARNTPAATKAELFGLFASDSNGTPRSTLTSGLTTATVNKVYDHEPAKNDRATPIALTVATAGVTPEDWVFAIRLYVDGGIGAKVAQDAIDTLIPLVESLLTGPYGPAGWEIGWIEEIGCFVATLMLMPGRETDF